MNIDQIKIENQCRNYMTAVEKKDPQLMKSVWRNRPEDRIYSVLGRFDGSSIIEELMEIVLPQTLSTFHIKNDKTEFIRSDDSSAIVQLSYDAVVAKNDQTPALFKHIVETQIYENIQDEWKLTYVHQSFLDRQEGMDDTAKMEMILDSMCQWHSDRNGVALPAFKGIKDRSEFLKERLKSFKGPADEEYIALQELYLKEKLKNAKIHVIPDIAPTGRSVSVWQHEPAAAAADCIISFVQPGQFIDPYLYMDAGVELQLDLIELQQHSPRKLLSLSGYHLPVKGVLEIIHPKIYGLMNKSKQDGFLELFESALSKASELGYRSIVVSPGWKEVLNIPEDFSEQMMEPVFKNTADGIEHIVFCASGSRMNKMLNAAVENNRTIHKTELEPE